MAATVDKATVGTPWSVHACIIAALLLATLIVYWQVNSFSFVNYDDVGYVVNNNRLNHGMTWENIAWAFATGRMANWHPMTWLSYMIDASIFGKSAGAFHVVNVVIHAINAVLLYFVMLRLSAGGSCGSWWRCGLAAALFALHPLHVESVAWISERKDVLSTFFGLLAVWTYAGYVRRRSTGTYLFVVLWFALSLMSKPMLVTLPAVLVLLDFWPLHRWPIARVRNGYSAARARSKHGAIPIGPARESAARLVLEKVPLLLLAAASSIVTLAVQQHGGAVRELTQMPMEARIVNAVVAYMYYLVDAIWPAGLAVLYPHPGKWAPLVVFSSVVALLGITIAVFMMRRKQPHLIVGWLFFIGTLAPVIGIVQVGEQARADRYMYVPLIGLIIMVVWSLPQQRSSQRALGALTTCAAVAALGACMVLTWRQIGVWQNTRTLFERALLVTSNNYTAHNNLGMALIVDGEFDQAMAHFQEAVRINDTFPEAHTNLGDAYVSTGQREKAMDHYQAALRTQPDFGLAHNGLGMQYAQAGDIPRAIEHFEAARRWDPYVANVQHNLGKLYAASGQLDRAIEMYREALTVAPDKRDVLRDLANALMATGDSVGAIQAYRDFIASKPDDALVNHNLAMLLIGQPQPSAEDLRQALLLAQRACDLTKQQSPEMLYALSVVQATSNDLEAARRTAQRAADLAHAAGNESLAGEISSFLHRLQQPNAGNPSPTP